MSAYRYHKCSVCGSVRDASVQCLQHPYAAMLGCNKDGYTGQVSTPVRYEFGRCHICSSITVGGTPCPEHPEALMHACNHDGFDNGPRGLLRAGDPMPYVNRGPVTPDEYRYASAHMRQAIAELEQVLHYAGRDPNVSTDLALTTLPDLLLPLAGHLRKKAAGG